MLVGRKQPEKEYVGPNRMGGDKLEKEGRRQNMEASVTTVMVESAEGVTVAEEAFVWHMQARRRGRRTQGGGNYDGTVFRWDGRNRIQEA